MKKILKNKKQIYIILILIIMFIIFINLNWIISNFLKTGAKYFEEKGNYQLTERLLKQNLYLQNKVMNNNSDLLILAIDDMIDFYNKQRLYDKSEKIYEKYLPLKIQYSNKTTSVFFDNSELNLAKVYSDLGTLKLKLGKYNEAEDYYKKALNIRKKNVGKSSLYIDNKLCSLDVGLWKELNNLGFLKIQEKKYKEAKIYFDEALKASQSKKNFAPWQIHYNLSILYRRLGDYSLAEKYAEELLINSPPLSENWKISYCPKNKLKFIEFTSKFDGLFKKNLAEIYIKEKRYKNAEYLIKVAVRIDEDLYNEKAPEILCDHYKLFDIYEKMNTKDSTKLKQEEYKQIESLKQNILSTKDRSGNNLISHLEIICKQ